ncbi:MAG: trans-sulfuration enzyme family protein [Candidatus Nanopelagicales bacterium]
MDSNSAAQPGPLRPTTVAICTGRPSQPGAPLNTPIAPATAFRAEDVGGYSRDSNPTWESFEEVVGALEGGAAWSFGSGMGAIAAAVAVGLSRAGAQGANRPIVAAPQVQYSGTRGLLGQLVQARQIEVIHYQPEDLEGATRAAAAADVVLIESPANPTMEITDIAAVARAARGVTIADNTYATPLATRPLALGVDIVVHSASKYLAGHSDALIGIAVTADPELAEALHAHRALHGATPGVLEAYLATRGVRTLALRTAAATANAGRIAQRLAARPDVGQVRYPGLLSDPGHKVADDQMNGFGSVITFVPVDGQDRADAIVRSTRLWIHATSLGGIESTLERRRSHAFESEEVPAALVRLSVGCEDVEDLWADLSAALDAAAGHQPG